MATDLLMMKSFNQGFVKGRLVEIRVEQTICQVDEADFVQDVVGEQVKKSMKKGMKIAMKRMMREMKREMKIMMRETKRAMKRMLRDEEGNKEAEEECNEAFDKGNKPMFFSEDDGDASEDSNYVGEDDLGPIVESDTDEEGADNSEALLPRMQEFRLVMDMREPRFRLGLVFPDVDTFRAAMREHDIREGKDIWFKKNYLN